MPDYNGKIGQPPAVQGADKVDTTGLKPKDDTKNPMLAKKPKKGQKDEKLQATLPGQLKGNVYGLFSFAVNIKLVKVQDREMRCLETRPTSSVVAKVRAPLAERPKANILYDLGDPKYDINHVVRELRLEGASG